MRRWEEPPANDLLDKRGGGGGEVERNRCIYHIYNRLNKELRREDRKAPVMQWPYLCPPRWVIFNSNSICLYWKRHGNGRSLAPFDQRVISWGHLISSVQSSSTEEASDIVFARVCAGGQRRSLEVTACSRTAAKHPATRVQLVLLSASKGLFFRPLRQGTLKARLCLKADFIEKERWPFRPWKAEGRQEMCHWRSNIEMSAGSAGLTAAAWMSGRCFSHGLEEH